MRTIALGLDFQENFFQDKIDAQDHNMRLLNYPAIKANLIREDGQARAGAHTDYGELITRTPSCNASDLDGLPKVL